MLRSAGGSERRRATWGLPLVAALVLGLAALAGGLVVASRSERPDPLRAAWERATDAGSYRFRSELEQAAAPVAGVAGAGRSSKVDRVRMEGSTDLDRSGSAFSVWSGDQPDSSTAPTMEVRVVDGVTEQRTAASEWKTVVGASPTLAPGGDALGFLAGARQVTDLGTQQRAGESVHRYGFVLDGTALSSTMLDALRSRGAVTPGNRVSASSPYREMTGSGELWVGESGLPVRQILTVEYAATTGGHTTAHMNVDFSDFGYAGDRSFFGALRQGNVPWQQVLLVVAALGVLGLVVVLGRRRSRPVRVIVAGVALSLVASSLGAASAGAQPAPAAPAPTTASDPLAGARALSAPKQAARPDPKTSLLAVPAVSQASADPTLDHGFGLTDDGLDLDEDGLTDYLERRIGTYISSSDTDGDGIGDRQEVDGFVLPGQTERWYTSPFDPDSNADGIPDNVEWDADENGAADDNDGDGLPDLFDDDNDNDGVRDNVDASASVKGAAVYTAAQPLQLTVDGLDTGEQVPTLVSFQVRPSDPKHLRAALNWLDWPTDVSGQLRDVNNSKNDIQLVPMLEITIPAGSRPPAEDLRDIYGIVDAHDNRWWLPLHLVSDPTTGERVAFGGQMIYRSGAWGPAQQVRLIWLAQMRNDQVCAATDAGCNADGYLLDRASIVGLYDDAWTLTGLNVTEEHGTTMGLLYQDPDVDPTPADTGATWNLAGILVEHFNNVVEGESASRLGPGNLVAKFDHTANAGAPLVAYDLPNVFTATSKNDYDTADDALNDLGKVGGRIDTALGAFNRHWSAPAPLHPLLVTASRSTQRSLGLDAVTAGTHGEQVARSVRLVLNPVGKEIPEITTSLVKWVRYCGGNGAAPVWRVCTPEESTAMVAEAIDGKAVDPDTAALLANPAAWQIKQQMAAASAFDTAMSTGYGAGFSVETLTGSTIVAIVDPDTDQILIQSLNRQAATSYRNGQSAHVAARMVQKGVYKFLEVESYKWTLKLEELQLADPSLKPNLLVKEEIGPIAAALATEDDLQVLGRGVKLRIHGGTLGQRVALVVGLVVAATVLFSTLVAAPCIEDGCSFPDFVVGVTAVAAIVFGTYQLADGIYKIVRTVDTANKFFYAQKLTYLMVSSQKAGMGSAKFGVIGAVIVALIAWGVIIYTLVDAGVPAFSPQFNEAIGDGIGTTLTITMLAAVSLNGVGFLVTLVLAIIDAILYFICEDDPDSLESGYLDGECFSTFAFMSKFASDLVYQSGQMLDDNADLTEIGVPDLVLGDSRAMYRAGNTVRVTLPITLNAKEVYDDGWSTFYAIPYLPVLYTPGNLASTTFNFSLTSGTEETVDAERGTMENEWTGVVAYDTWGATSLNKGTATKTVTGSAIPLTAGLNQKVQATLNTGYALPMFECTVLPFPPPVASYCWKNSNINSSSDALDPLVLDVLPADVDGLMALERRFGHDALAWDQAFGPLQDADFDGVDAVEFGGLDPDDRNWDTDGDGLGDAIELAAREAGEAFNPSLGDTDLDGLTDRQERELGTNPAVADTDNDGLDDGVEVRHQVYAISGGTWGATAGFAGGWQIHVAGPWAAGGTTDRLVWVSSDPLRADGDGDGLSDQAERDLAAAYNTGACANHLATGCMARDPDNLPFNPSAANRSPLAVTATIAGGSPYASPGQTLTVRTEATTSAALEPGVVEVSRSGAPAATSGPQLMAFDPVGNLPQTRSAETDITLPTASGRYNVTATVRTRLRSGPALPPAWSVNVETPIAATKPNGMVRLATRGWGGYALAEENSTDAARGDVQIRVLGEGPAAGLDSDAGARRLNEKAVADNSVPWPTPATYGTADSAAQRQHRLAAACNDAGRCATLWQERPDCGTLSLYSVYAVKGTDAGGTSGVDLLPVVQYPDGKEFVDFWHYGVNRTDGTGTAWATPGEYDFCGSGITLDLYEMDITQYAWPTGGTRVATIPLSASAPTKGTGTYGVDEPLWNYCASYGTSDPDRISVCAGWYQDGDNYGGIRYSVSPTSSSYSIGDTPSTNPRIAGAVTTGTGATPDTGAQTVLSAANEAATDPVLASDGAGFAWVWKSTPVDYAGSSTGPSVLKIRRGTSLGDAQPPVTLAGVSGRPVQLDWTGSSWRLLTTTDGLMWSITDIAFDTQGQPVTAAFGPARNNVSAMATDSGTGRSLLAYWNEGSQSLLMTVDGTTGPTAGPLDQVTAAAFNPLTGGWLVVDQTQTGPEQAQSTVRAYAADLTALEAKPSGLSEYYSSALACPASQSMPLVDLRFEELPGATTFADSSGRANPAGSAPGAAPAAGYAGALNGSHGAPGSDYSVHFDGAADALSLADNPAGAAVSLAFWYRHTASGSGTPFTIGGAGSHPYVLEIDPDGGVSWNSKTVSGSFTGLADGKWHSVTATRSAAPSYSEVSSWPALYVDGERVVAWTGPWSNPTVATPGVQIHGGSPAVQLDQLQVFATSLFPERVEALYERSDLPVCVMTNTYRAQDAEWARLPFAEVDPRSGALTSTARVSVIVDADDPVSNAAAPAAPIKGGPSTTYRVGGTASDPTSGVAKVEVRVTRPGGSAGAWTEVGGLEAWSFDLDTTTTGTYLVQSRATDLTGRVETPQPAVSVLVDTQAPVVSAIAPTAVSGFVAVQTDPGTGRKSLRLTGTATDAGGAGIPSDGVEVLVLLASRTSAAADGWVKASVQAGTPASWTTDFPFANGVLDVSGTYKVWLRGTDRAGNRSQPAIGLASLKIDDRAPTVTSLTPPVLKGGSDVAGTANDRAGVGVGTVDLALVELSDALAAQAQGVDPTRSWMSANLDRGEWSVQIGPGWAGDLYQLDVRVADRVGNVRVIPGVWRGVIDSAAPVLTLDVMSTGNTNSTGAKQYTVTCSATDFSLDPATFSCPGASTPTRQYSAVPAGILTNLFPNQVRISGLTAQGTVWSKDPNQAFTFNACDAWKNTNNVVSPAQCATTTKLAGSLAPAPAAAASTADVASLRASVTDPFPGQHVQLGGTGTIAVGAYAESSVALQSVTVLVDDTEAGAASLVAGSTMYDAPVSTSATGGAHTVKVLAADAAAATVTSSQVSVFVDVSAPTVTLGSTSLGLDDSWGVATNVLVVDGTVEDDGVIVAVQAKVGDGQWQDVIFDQGAKTWSGALKVLNPDGMTLPVSVRAFDRSGRKGELGSTLSIDFKPSTPGFTRADTTMLTGPTAPSTATTATFTFSGTKGTKDLHGFFCSLDGQPVQACTSPWTVSGLAAGTHRLEVAAFDVDGLADLSPATRDWTVIASGPQATLKEKPDALSASSAARFAFTAPSGGTFTCSLDGATPTACTSPISYAGLAYGRHTFAVTATVGANSGSPLAYIWNVVDGPPSVRNSVLTLNANSTGEPLTLVGADADPLTYRIVRNPDHGTLTGAAPNLIYVPEPNYYGPDAFSFVANDGQTDSGEAVVSVTVLMAGFSVYGDEGVEIGDGVTIGRDGVGVNRASSGSGPKVWELSVGQKSIMSDPSARAVADSVRIGKSSSLYNVGYNDWDNKGKALGTATKPLSVPFAPLPALASFGAAGGSDVKVSAKTAVRLDAGLYRSLKVDPKAQLVLTGGVYTFASWDVGKEASVRVEAPSEIRVLGVVNVGEKATVGVKAGVVGLDARDLVVQVAGVNSPNSTAGAANAAFTAGKNSTVDAYVLAPNGTVRVGEGVFGTGSFIGRWVILGKGTRIGRWTDINKGR